MKYWLLLLMSLPLGAQEKRSIPVRVEEVTVVPSKHGVNNIQMVKAAIPMGKDHKDIKLWMMCSDFYPHCYPLRPGQTYNTWAINEGELGYEECETDHGQNFCVSMNGAFDGKKVTTIYVMGLVKEER